LLSLSNNIEEFQHAGVQLYGIFCQKADSVKQWAAENSIAFPLLIDADRVIAKEYGVYVRISYDAFNIARPANFLIGTSGLIRYVYVSSHQWDRAATNTLVSEARNKATA
jgi:peroxiredoxin